ncbi:MAG: GAF domain-containing protein [Cyclobacteriaceae bacterium]
MLSGFFTNKNCKELQLKVSSLQSETAIAVRLLKSIEKQDWNSIQEFSNEDNSKLLETVRNLGTSVVALMKNEHEQLWKANTLADFSSVFQDSQNNLEVLAKAYLSKAIKAMGAGLGLIYVTKEKTEKDVVLEIKAAYASVERKLYSEVEIGDGLVGQCYADKKRILLTKIPTNFIKINSSLGSALPKCVLLQPLQSNGRLVGVIELSSFKLFSPVQLDFMEQVSECIASAIISVKESERMKKLLSEFEKMSNELQANDRQQRQRTIELEKAHTEIETKKREIQEILERESELIESKIKTHRELTDVIINKLKSKVTDLERQLTAPQSMAVSYA